MQSRPNIQCTQDGPYLVKGLARFLGPGGAALPAEAVMALCRCGGSDSKPFCDGTHQKNGFSGAREGGDADRRTDYRGAKITIHDNRSICAHAGRCTDGLAPVFKFGSEPWIDPDGAAAAAVIQTVRTCPSGALSHSVDGVEHRDDPQREPGLTVSKDGPYEVVGGVELPGASWGEGASTEHYTLCRCGASANKPFCDGSHFRVGFRDG